MKKEEDDEDIMMDGAVPDGDQIRSAGFMHTVKQEFMEDHDHQMDAPDIRQMADHSGEFLKNINSVSFGLTSPIQP